MLPVTLSCETGPREHTLGMYVSAVNYFSSAMTLGIVQMLDSHE